jgi:hypothetical protein
MFAGHTLNKLSALVRANPAVITRAVTTSNLCRLAALSRANSAVLSQTIDLIDSMIHGRDMAAANKIFNTEDPIVGTTIGKQLRHSYDHLEKVALDGLRTVRDKDKPIDLHYDVRERGILSETDVGEARQRALFIQDVFDGVLANSDAEGNEQCFTDGARRLTAYFTLPTGTSAEAEELALASTLEREMGFVCHHAIHHCALIRAIVASGSTPLTLEDLPEDFGRPPTTLVSFVDDAAA